MDIIGTSGNHFMVLHPDGQAEHSRRAFWSRSVKQKRVSSHGLPQTYTRNIGYETPPPASSLFCDSRVYPFGLKAPCSWSEIGESVRRFISDRKMTVEMPASLIGEIKKYQRSFRKETVGMDAFVICDSPKIKPEETHPSTPNSDDPRTLPPTYVRDDALLRSLGQNPEKCRGLVIPTTIDEMCVFHIQQSKLRSNCQILAPLVSLFVKPDVITSGLKSIIKVREHQESHSEVSHAAPQITATVLLQDHETHDTVPVTVTTDPLIDEQIHSIYSRNQYVSWVTCIEKAVHGYMAAKCNQIEVRPPDTAPILHENTCDDMVNLCLPSIQQEETQYSETEVFKGNKATIFDHGDADLAYRLFSSAVKTNSNKKLIKLRNLDVDSIKQLQDHVRRKQPAVIGTAFGYGKALAMPINGLKPGHLYGILGEGYEVTNGNRKAGLFIYDSYGEQGEEILKLKIDKDNKASADFTKGCLLFEPYDTLGRRFNSATLYQT